MDLDCPLKKGKQKIVKDVAIPKEVPPVCFHLCLCEVDVLGA